MKYFFVIIPLIIVLLVMPITVDINNNKVTISGSVAHADLLNWLSNLFTGGSDKNTDYSKKKNTGGTGDKKTGRDSRSGDKRTTTDTTTPRYVTDTDEDGRFEIVEICPENGKFIRTGKFYYGPVEERRYGEFTNSCGASTCDSDDSSDDPPTRIPWCESPPNACGQTNKGKCPQSTPSNPSYLGEPCTGTFIENWCGIDIERTKFGVKSCENKCINFVLPDPIKTTCNECPAGSPPGAVYPNCDKTCPAGSPPGAVYPYCDKSKTCPAGSPVGAQWPFCDKICPVESPPGAVYPDCDRIECNNGLECDPPPPGDLAIKLEADKLLVRKGETINLTWTIANADSCKLFKDGKLIWKDKNESGRKQYKIMQVTEFRLVCKKGGEEASDEVIVRPLPRWREI